MLQILASRRSVEQERKLQLETQKAFLGFGVMRLPAEQKQPEVHLAFGKYNDRVVQEREMRKMSEDFQLGLARYVENPMPVVVRKAWIEEDSLEEKIDNVREVDMKKVGRVRWTAAVKGKRVEVLNGRHRNEAMEMAINSLKERIEAGEGKMKKMKGKEAEKERLKKTVEEMKGLRGELGYWMGAFYDEGE